MWSNKTIQHLDVFSFLLYFFFHRLGGCFITFVQGMYFVLVILALATVACFITYYATNDTSQVNFRFEEMWCPISGV